MTTEEISKIEILDNNEMYVVLASGGKPGYELIYREAAEVYWDDERKGFRAPTPKKWSHSDWFHHIVKVTRACNIKLILTNKTVWVNVPQGTKEEICAS